MIVFNECYIFKRTKLIDKISPCFFMDVEIKLKFFMLNLIDLWFIHIYIYSNGIN